MASEGKVIEPSSPGHFPGPVSQHVPLGITHYFVSGGVCLLQEKPLYDKPDDANCLLLFKPPSHGGLGLKHGRLNTSMFTLLSHQSKREGWKSCSRKGKGENKVTSAYTALKVEMLTYSG